MKTFTVFLILVVACMTTVAYAETSFSVGASIPFVGEWLFSGKDTEVHAAPNLLVTTSETSTGPDRADFQGGYPNIPSNDYSRKVSLFKDTNWAQDGLFPEFNFLRIDVLLLGIKPENVVKSEFKSDDPHLSYVGGRLNVDLSNMTPGKYSLVYSVIQNGSRKDRRYLFIKIVRHPENKDEKAFVFTILDPLKSVDTMLNGFGDSYPGLGFDDIAKLARSAYLTEEVGSFKLIESEPSFKILSSIVANRLIRQNSQPPAPVSYDFAVNFLNSDGTFVENCDATVWIKDPQGNEKEYHGGPSIPFGGFSAGSYQLKIKESHYVDKGWAPFNPANGDVNLRRVR